MLTSGQLFGRRILIGAIAIWLTAVPAVAQVQTPEQFFGFALGTDGELARYPRIVEYMQHLAASSDRVTFEELGTSTMGHPYVLVTVSSAENLARVGEYVEMNQRLADPRGLSDEEARRLARESRPFYLLYASIHATEVGNTQAVNEIAHRLATSDEPEVREILDNVILLLVPSQNPDGQVLVVDHWYRTKGTALNRVYPDLYHKYVGHDNNRDWFMFTQQETRLMVEKVQNAYRPQLSHDMHQQGPTGTRIFVPPFQDPYDPNFHPVLAQEQAQIGLAMASALIAEGKTGVTYNAQYDLWTPARQYMIYHGQPRILTEIASASLADPFVNPAGRDVPLGPQESRMNFPVPYDRGEWRLRQILDYANTAVFAALTHMAKYRVTWLDNFHRVHRDWVTRTQAPFAFVVPAAQRDPYETFELLDLLHFGDVEVHRAGAPFTAGGREYAAGSWVILLNQPYGAFAKTMLERQVYPDLRLFPGGPPLPPYDVTAHTLGDLLGVEVHQIEDAFEGGDLQRLETISPVASPLPERPRWAYVVGPESNATYVAVARLQAAGVPIFRTAAAFAVGQTTYAAGSWIVPPQAEATRVLTEVARDTGLRVGGADEAPAVSGFRLKQPTRIGLWRGANNMPGGWLMWLFEQYGFNHGIVTAQDVRDGLSSKYDVLVLPDGITREVIVDGLDPARHDEAWAWAYGVGDAGWQAVRQWVLEGGTLVAIGNAVETARALLDLPIENVLPDAPRRRAGRGAETEAGPRVPVSEVDRLMRDAFQSPASLIAALEQRVVLPQNLFYCPGSLLLNEIDASHPVGFGMPASWPVFFRHNQAYRLKPGFGVAAEVVARYPDEADRILQSGWLLGADRLRDQANVVAFRVGKGSVVTLATEVEFRTQPRATFKLLFNAMYQGPADALSPAQLARLEAPGATE